MTFGPNHPSGHGHGGGKKRRGRRRGGPGAHKGGGKGPHQQPAHAGIYTAPMDHSYRQALNGNNNNSQLQGRGPRRGMPPIGEYVPAEPEPLPADHEHGAPRIFAFIDDLFFTAKIQETARKLNVKVEFVKTDKEILERVEENGNGKPSLIIFDLNSNTSKPLTTIPKLKKELKRETTIIGFLSHLQGELKLKAQEAGCDMVVPRSAFSQNLPQLLRRHGAPDDLEQ